MQSRASDCVTVAKRCGERVREVQGFAGYGSAGRRTWCRKGCGREGISLRRERRNTKGVLEREEALRAGEACLVLALIATAGIGTRPASSRTPALPARVVRAKQAPRRKAPLSLRARGVCKRGDGVAKQRQVQRTRPPYPPAADARPVGH